MGPDNLVLGWTPDGKILFRGLRGPIRGFVGEPYVVSPEGGPVERFPLPESGAISFSPDGKKIAYNRIFRDFRTWKRYKGGMAQDVWVYDLGSKAIERITDWPGTDTQPMWIGGSVYFLSDRDGWKGNLWRYDVDDEGDVARDVVHRIRREVAALPEATRSPSRTAAFSTSSTRRAGRAAR